VTRTEIPTRKTWKRDLDRYLEIDPGRSRRQLAGVILPYMGVWAAAAILRPHGSMFAARRANTRWGYVLGFLLFTPYRWWQRQHSLHHANTGNLDKRGPGEIFTMTVAEYERASRLRRLAYRTYRHPLLLLAIGPSLVFLFERRFPQRGMTSKILLSVVLTNLALAGWAVGWSLLAGWQTFLLIQGTTLVAGGAVAAWMLYIQHQYEETYFQSGGDWQFELAALQGSSYLELPRLLTWAVGNANYHHVHHLSARIPNYNLRAAHEEQPMFAHTPVVTLRGSLAAFRLKLWDEDRGCLVG
jgi:omega-6 fatty acid desaturase (delta-12 desaturase)